MNDLDMAVSRLTDALAASDELGMPQVACDRDTARAVLAALAASPQQSPISGEGAEPVAWRYRWNGWPEGMWDVAFSDAKEQWRGVAGLTAEPLYTAPPVPSVLVGEGQGSNRKGDLPTEQAVDGSSGNEGAA